MIGIAFVSKKVEKIFNKNTDVIFIDDHGFWGCSNDSSERILLPTIQHNFFSEAFSVDVARRYLNWYMPLWARWIPQADQYEKKKEQSLVSIYNIFVMLNYYKINSVIFHTGVAHGVNDIFLSIACRLKKIKQIYLYGQVINGRLLPILQSDDIKTRIPLNIEVSSFKFDKSIYEFIDRKILELLPATAISLDFWKKSLLFVFIFILRREIFSIIKKINFTKGLLPSSFIVASKIDKYSFFEDLRIVNNQRLYIKALLKEIISDKELNILRSSNKPKLLIAAHYQPEATSFPEGDDYYSNIDIVFAIRNKKYNDQILYKEHPGTFLYLCKIVGLTKVGIHRSPVYLGLLKDLGCKFLPSNYHLSINNDFNWYVPVTITGTIAIERALMGLHTIYTGVPWYKGMPGTIYINEIKSLEEIPIEWTKCDPLIQSNAKNFLENKLNNKTIANISGISTGVPDNAKESEKDFELGILKILKWLNNN
jgi:hypothetical protein